MSRPTLIFFIVLAFKCLLSNAKTINPNFAGSRINRPGSSLSMVTESNKMSFRVKSPKIIIAGAPAAGKGTQCEIIRKDFGVVHLSTGDILRAAVNEKSELGLKAKSYMDSGTLVPDELIIDVVCDRLKQPDCQTNGWLLDGFPRTQSQADALNAAGMIPDCFILLDVPEAALVERVTGRRTDPVTGKIYHLKFNPPENEEIAKRLTQRSDDTEEKIVTRYRDFRNNIDSVKFSYMGKMVLVNGAVSQAEVSKQITTALLDFKRPVGVTSVGTTTTMDVSKDESKKNTNTNNTVDATETAKWTVDLHSSAPSSSSSSSSSHSKSIAVSSSVSSSSSTVSQLVSKFTEISHVVLSILSLTAINQITKASLLKLGLTSFPSSLAAMMMVFLSLNTFSSPFPNTIQKIANAFEPGVSFIASTLLLYFIPPLVVLPLKMALISNSIVQLLVIAIIGLFTSMTFTAVISNALVNIFPSSTSNKSSISSSSGSRISDISESEKQQIQVYKTAQQLAQKADPGRWPPNIKVFPKSIDNPKAFQFPSPLPCFMITALSLFLTSSFFPFRSNPTQLLLLQRVLGFSATIGSFLLSQKAPKTLKTIVHPAFLTATGISLLLNLGGKVSGVSTATMLGNYYGNSMLNNGMKGAGDLISIMLTPAIVSLGFHLFTNKLMLINNAATVLLSTFSTAVFSLFTTAWLTKLMKLSPKQVALSTLTRSITTPLALIGASLLQAESTVASLLVVFNGVLGAIFGPIFLEKILGMKNPLVVGLSVGGSSHGVGTAALAQEPKKFAASVVSMTLTGFFTVALLTHVPTRELLIKLATTTVAVAVKAKK